MGTNGDLVLVDPSQGKGSPLPGVQGHGDAIDPSWSPDGQEVAYVQQTAPMPGDPVPLGRAYLRAYNPATKQDRVIHEEPPGALLYHPAWVPDGQSLYYGRVEHHFDGPRYQGFQEMIMRIGRDGQNPTQVLLDAASPSVSPDGQQIVFITHEPAPREPGLWRLDLASGATTNLVAGPSPVEINAPIYAPDGQTVAFSASALSGLANFKTGRALWEPPVAEAHGLPADIWMVAPDGSNLHQFTKLNEDRLLPAYAPDGQSIAALGLGGLYVFGLDGRQRALFKQLGGEGSTTWGRQP